MKLVIPNEAQLRRPEPRLFANEVQLQRFVEDRVLPSSGFEVVSSSEQPGKRLGRIDTTAVSADGIPVIVEYKHDEVDGGAMSQLEKYRHWLLDHRELFEESAKSQLQGASVKWEELHSVAVGYRFRLDHPPISYEEAAVTLLHYGYGEDNNVWIREVERGLIGGGPHPKVSKDDSLDKHLAKTTPAARLAFEDLRYRLKGIGLDERIHGKNRVRYWSSMLAVELTFTDVAIQCFFVGDGVEDPEGRTRATSKGSWNWTCGVAGQADVDYAFRVIRDAIGRSSDV